MKIYNLKINLLFGFLSNQIHETQTDTQTVFTSGVKNPVGNINFPKDPFHYIISLLKASLQLFSQLF